MSPKMQSMIMLIILKSQNSCKVNMIKTTEIKKNPSRVDAITPCHVDWTAEAEG